MDLTVLEAYKYITTGNRHYLRHRPNWQVLLDSYVGGVDWQNGGYLTRYALETAGDYSQRLRNTPLDNHSKSVIAVYTSFLFRRPPDRNFGTWAEDPAVLAKCSLRNSAMRP